MPSRIPVVCLRSLLQLHLLCSAFADSSNGEMAAAVRLSQDAILAAMERSLRRYVQIGVSGSDPPDVNLMLGVSMMEGQMMSCTKHPQTNYIDRGFDRTHLLTWMTNELHAIFYDRNLPDMKTIGRILDRKLWTSPEQIVPICVTPGSFYADFLDNSIDSLFRDVSDECIRRVISSCNVTPECLGLELTNGFSGYALTHQVLYVHILKRTCRNNDPIFQKVLENKICHKCSKIFKEALYIASNLSILEKYKDLFIEQIAICGMQNMVEFIRPEWLSIILSSRNTSNCVQYKNNYASCESHLTGVSLAALGVYWKFLCYKVNAILYSEHNKNILLP